jgi:hypothetical protein
MWDNSDEEKGVRATGWFQASNFEGTRSPSTHLRSSSHQGVRTASLSPTFSMSWTHLVDRWLIRAVIQSRVRSARWSSCSRHASSISSKSENLRAKEVWGTETRAVVLVVTRDD